MSKQLFVNNADQIPAADGNINTPADVPEARIAAFDADDYSRGTLDLTSETDADRVVFVQGGKNGEDPIISSIINVNEDIEDANETIYTPPVPQETTVTPATGTGFATIKLVRSDTGHQPFERKTFEVKLDDKTLTEIVDEYVQKINDSSFHVTAANNADELVITAETDESDHTNPAVSFETITDGEAAGWAISTNSPDYGSGTPFHVENIQEIAWGGQYQNRVYLPITPPDYVEESNYDLATLRVKTNTTPNIAKSNTVQELIFAIVTGGDDGGTDPQPDNSFDLTTFLGL